MIRLEGVWKSFGGVRAVRDVSLDLDGVSICGLVGPNGSGKTTLFHIITGFYSLDKGRVLFKGRHFENLPPHRISRMGISRTFQQSRVIPTLTVEENLLAAPQGQLGERIIPLFFAPIRVISQERAQRERAREVLESLNLAHMARQPAGRLSYGQQKLLELGRPLMPRPELVLLDEPTSGVNPVLIRQLMDIIKELSRATTTFFIVEHNMSFVTQLCERVYVMESGRIIFSGRPEEARSDEAVIRAYLGGAEGVV